jgi:hypothetical protein
VLRRPARDAAVGLPNPLAFVVRDFSGADVTFDGVRLAQVDKRVPESVTQFAGVALAAIDVRPPSLG